MHRRPVERDGAGMGRFLDELLLSCLADGDCGGGRCGRHGKRNSVHAWCDNGEDDSSRFVGEHHDTIGWWEFSVSDLHIVKWKTRSAHCQHGKREYRRDGVYLSDVCGRERVKRPSRPRRCAGRDKPMVLRKPRQCGGCLHPERSREPRSREKHGNGWKRDNC